MVKRFSSIFFLTIIFISPPLSKTVFCFDLSAGLAEKVFYNKPDHIINQFEKKSKNCQVNFILAKAFKDKKDLKNSLLYYSNSCFNNKYDFNIRLFPQPVYSFILSPGERSIFYQDSVFEIASLFYKYGEYNYVLKFTDLIVNDKTSLYRESLFLRSRTNQRLKRYNQSIDDLLKITALYKDKDSQSAAYIRLGSVFESAGDYLKAADSYFNVIKTDNSGWQNSIAARRIVYLIDNEKIKHYHAENSILLASVLYDAGDYKRSYKIADSILNNEKSDSAEKIKLKILTLTDYPKAVIFLKSKEREENYNDMLLLHADIIWAGRKKSKAIKIYEKLASVPDSKISERALTMLSSYYEKKSQTEFIKYVDLYITKFPDNPLCGRFIWMIGRYYLKSGNKSKAVDYFNRSLKDYPDNVYTSYSRYWLQKVEVAKNKDGMSDEFLSELVSNNPETYHALTLLKKKSSSTENSVLIKQYEDSLKEKNNKKQLLYHCLLYLKNGYDSYYNVRIKQLGSDTYDQYREIKDLLKNPVCYSVYQQLLKKIDLYFSAGDIEAANREIKLIPIDDYKSQIDLELALTVYSIKYKNYNYSTYYGFKLLNLLKIKENISLLPIEFTEALYPYAFRECVNEQSRIFNLKPEFLLAVMKAESNFNSKAFSPAGASGLMQMMPATAKQLSRELGIVNYNLADSCTSIKLGSKYLSWLNHRYSKQVDYIISGYNAGIGTVDKWIAGSDAKDVDTFSEFRTFDETRDYIYRIKKYIIQYESIYKTQEN